MFFIFCGAPSFLCLLNLKKELWLCKTPRTNVVQNKMSVDDDLLLGFDPNWEPKPFSNHRLELTAMSMDLDHGNQTARTNVHQRLHLVGQCFH